MKEQKYNNSSGADVKCVIFMAYEHIWNEKH